MTPATLSINRLSHRCFPEILQKFLRAPFFKEHMQWLLLTMIDIYNFLRENLTIVPLTVVVAILQNVTPEGKNKEDEVCIFTTNSSNKDNVEAREARENEETRKDFCYFLDKKLSDYGKLEFVFQHIPQNPLPNKKV